MTGITELERITEEEKIAIDNDFDPIEAPPGPYKIQPEKPGEIFFDVFKNQHSEHQARSCGSRELLAWASPPLLRSWPGRRSMFTMKLTALLR